MFGSEARPLVLGYHAVSSTWRTQLAVSEALLSSQLDFFANRGYVGFTLSVAERRRREGTLPRRSLVVTFDDGYASTLRAAPILRKFGFPGTVFVVTGFLDSGEPLSWPGIDEFRGSDAGDELRALTWGHVEELAASGWEIGSHTVSHPLLTEANDERLHSELERSRAAIAERIGSCTSLAYPYGLADERVAAAAGRTGHEVACTLTFAHFADEPLRRPRVGIGPTDTGVRLRLQGSHFGQAARRSSAARLARALHRRRTWLPAQ